MDGTTTMELEQQQQLKLKWHTLWHGRATTLPNTKFSLGLAAGLDAGPPTHVGFAPEISRTPH